MEKTELGAKSMYKESTTALSILPPIQDHNKQKRRSVMFLYNFWIGPGNNGQLVKRILETRDNWVQVSEADRCHFRWAQSNRSYKYSLLSSGYNKQMVNHFEFHPEISDKANLIRSLNQYCENVSKVNMFTITPPTFVIDFNDIFCDKALNQFLAYYCKYYPKLPPSETNRMKMEYLKHFKNMVTGTGHKFRQLGNKYCKQVMLDTFMDEANQGYMWVLKPTSLNRGRGVRVFSELSTLREYFNQYTLGYVEKPLRRGSMCQTTAISSTNTSTIASTNTSSLIKTDAFVIQKYIEKPLVVSKRKFDIRTWVLVDHEMNVYFFRDGYVRMSSEQYDLTSKNIQNSFVHLTNNAIQKHSENYCKFESGNQLSFTNLQKTLAADYKQTINRQVREGAISSAAQFFVAIRNRMKEIAVISMQSVRKKLNQLNRKHCMEIFGYDFMLDQQLRVWLIEVNTNPCIEESSPLLGQLIPRMINDAFKLTIDVLFPKWNQVSDNQSNKLKIIEVKVPQRVVNKSSTVFHVDGYDDDVNLWDPILDKDNKIQLLKENFQIQDDSHPYIVFEQHWWKSCLANRLRNFMCAGESSKGGGTDAAIQKFRNKLTKSCASVLQEISSLSKNLSSNMNNLADQSVEGDSEETSEVLGHSKSNSRVSSVSSTSKHISPDTEAQTTALQKENVLLVSRLIEVTETCIGLIDNVQGLEKRNHALKKEYSMACNMIQQRKLISPESVPNLLTGKSMVKNNNASYPTQRKAPFRNELFRSEAAGTAAVQNTSNNNNNTKQLTSREMRQYSSNQHWDAINNVRLGSPMGQRILNRRAEELNANNRKHTLHGSVSPGVGSNRKAIIDKIRQIRGLMNVS